MIFALLRILLVFVLWWVALWFVLPTDWLQGGLLSLVAVPIAPPLMALAAWKLIKRAWAWRAARAKTAAAEKAAAENKSREEAIQAAQQEELDRRRAHVECRGVWAVLSKMPDWMHEEIESSLILRGNDESPMSLLRQVLGAAFEQNAAIAWLPVRLDHDSAHMGWIEEGWKEALASSSIAPAYWPPSPDCQRLPGTGNLAKRVIDLFKDDPALPAVLVLGLDSPQLAPRPPGTTQAALALLFCRPGLAALEIGRTDIDVHDFNERKTTPDPYTPYWERNSDRETGALPWKNIPPLLRPDFLSRCTLVATLHNPVEFVMEPGRTRTLAQQVHGAMLESFVCAGLRDAPAEEKEASGPEDREAVEIGWLVHDSSDTARFTALNRALVDCGYELDSIDEASKPRDECGDVGAAYGTLMLATAAIRAAQLKKPVLLVGFGENGGMSIGVSRPWTEA